MEIPIYPAARELVLADKPHLDERLRHLSPRVSELSFANLYLFRRAHSYRLTRIDEVPVILGNGYSGEPYFLPPLDAAPAAALNYLLQQGMTLYGADDEFIRRHCAGAGMEIIEDRDNFDYLYLRAELADLSGSRYHKKKNRINYLLRHAHVTVEVFGELHVEGALRLLDGWQRIKVQEGKKSLALEVEAAAEAVRLYRDVGLQGVVALVGGEVKAFALGERLNEQTSVCHFEKADLYMEGLSQFVDREFNSLLFTDCMFVNREQDLGDAGLRAAKMTYHPIELIKKYRVTLTRR